LCQDSVLQAKLLPRELLVIAHRFWQYICKVHKSTDAWSFSALNLVYSGKFISS
jgi:hypothetical protein